MKKILNLKNIYFYVIILYTFELKSIESQGKPLKPNCESPTSCQLLNEKIDFNRIMGDVSYSDEYEMHWGLAVVAVLPLIAVIIAIIVWRFCKSRRNSNVSDSSVRDTQNNKRSVSNEDSSC